MPPVHENIASNHDPSFGSELNYFIQVPQATDAPQGPVLCRYKASQVCRSQGPVLWRLLKNYLFFTSVHIYLHVYEAQKSFVSVFEN